MMHHVLSSEARISACISYLWKSTLFLPTASAIRESLLACKSGFSGPDFKKGVIHIMIRQIGCVLNLSEKLLAGMAAAAVLALAIVLGFTHVITVQAQGRSENQATETHIAFSVASVKRVPLGPSSYRETPDAIRYTCALVHLVQRAYQIEPYLLAETPLLGSPADQLYEIQAKFPEGANRNDIPAMLRSLLSERFHFAAHWEQRPIPVYILLPDAGGVHLKPHRSDVERPASVVPTWARVAFGPQRPRLHVPSTGLYYFSEPATTGELAASLTTVMDRPVLDRTGIDGVFDITVHAHVPPQLIQLPPLPIQGHERTGAGHQGSERDYTLSNGVVVSGDAPPLSAALLKMGLRIEKSKEPVRVLVVDAVNRVPTAN